MREKASGIVLKCLEEKKLSQIQLAARMGEKNSKGEIDSRGLNQQLHRQKDMKVERFTDVLDHIGYRVEVVENDGIQKVSKDFALEIIEAREPIGLFWYFDEERYVGIDNTAGEVWTNDFETKEECFEWLRGGGRK